MANMFIWRPNTYIDSPFGNITGVMLFQFNKTTRRDHF